MIPLFEASILAGTKLRTHKIRTGIAVAIAGLLFGLIVFVLIVMQGVFDSINTFSQVGLNNRAVLSIAHFQSSVSFNEYDHMDDPDFVAEVESAHKALIQKKQAAAKKYSISYEPLLEDPSPIAIDPLTKRKSITDSGLSSESVRQVADRKRAEKNVPFSIQDYVQPYQSAILRGTFTQIQPTDGMLTYMKEGKENLSTSANRQNTYQQTAEQPTISVIDGSIAQPFITNTSFDFSQGDIPVIFPVSTAEKLMGLTPLEKKAPLSEKRERLSFIRNNINTATSSFCYRNQASQALVSQAISQRDEIKKAAGKVEYVKPSLLYAVPSDTDCGAVIVTSDKRTSAEKKVDENIVLYQKEIGTWLGEPQQQKITVRGVGISSDIAGTATQYSISDMIQSLLGSSLGFNAWAIPSDMLAKVPAVFKPSGVFNPTPSTVAASYSFGDTYLVEFADKNQARTLLEKTGAIMGSGTSTETYAYPFGSGILLVDEMRRWVETALFWVLLAVSGVAVIILAGIIGRTVSDGRRESAVFRAIGASRGDIARIYGVYTVLLSFRVVVFAALLGLFLACIVQLLFAKEATLGAQLAYAASDTTLSFQLMSINSWYLLIVFGVIMTIGLLASVVPIILGSRRSPIRDMRNDS